MVLFAAKPVWRCVYKRDKVRVYHGAGKYGERE